MLCRADSDNAKVVQARRPHHKEARRGFSLVEIMIVIAIIGLLAGVVTINVRGRMAKARETVARQDIRNIVHALDEFWSENKRFPTNEEGLTVLYTKTEKHPEPLLAKEPVDPWGRAYVYICPGAKSAFEVISRGPDNRDTGAGVISSDDLPQKASP